MLLIPKCYRLMMFGAFTMCNVSIISVKAFDVTITEHWCRTHCCEEGPICQMQQPRLIKYLAKTKTWIYILSTTTNVMCHCT